TDRPGRGAVHFGAPRPRSVSAATALDPSFNPRQFERQIVLLGVTGLGLLDQKLTPFGLTQGIDVHAQLIESILGDALLHRPAKIFWIELGALLIAGLAVIWLVRYDS